MFEFASTIVWLRYLCQQNLGDTHLTNNTISHNNSTIGGGGIASVAIDHFLENTYLRNNIIAKNNNLVGTNIIRHLS